ncbi:helix-turn-helix transcriptional regulator [Xylanimonas ulmi]|uniref:ATP/maltotriose-dependent transcriptional regulator MalT n=1 Tax=Xylanimonas ulmi TaxID=228973 RepID=A0A4Q7M1T9_9MICO|nr:helix-turn-helix transcriptional regulator [Xylanibacterium ulmi]RZS61816.1 ATP/maltotriose-dependent transcriptional regulator MalT [Xylanibacterium ulmi]
MDFAPTAIECLAKGVSVEIVGRPGSGRSVVLDEVCAILRLREQRPIRVRGIGALRERPLATLLASLPELGRQTSICESVNYLRDEVSPQGVLVVDDVDDLDDVSAGVVAAVRATTSAPMIVSRRIGPRPAAPLRRLLAAAQPSIRHLVRPLTFDALRGVLERDLGAPVAAATMARIATMSGGLPGLARAISLVAQRTGRLTLSGDVWAATGSLWSPQLGQAVEALLVDASAEDVDALTLLAAAGPFAVQDARVMIPGTQLERLNELGLVEVIDGADEGAVGLYPPVVGEYLARECTSSKRAAIRQRLAVEGRAPSGRLAHDVVAALPVGDAILSRIIADDQRAEARERLAAWEDDPTATAAIPLLVALFQAEDPIADAADVYARTDGSSCSESANVEFASGYALYQATSRGDREGAAASLNDLVRRYPNARGAADAVAAHMEMVLDRVPATVGVDTLSGASFCEEVGWGASLEHKIARGEAVSTLAEFDRCQPENSVLRYHGDVCRGLALLYSGEVDQARLWVSKRFDTARSERSPGALQSLGYVAALAAAVQGNIERLEEVVSLIMTFTAVPAFDAQYRSGVVGLSEAKARWLGQDATPCRKARDQAERQRFGPFPFMATSPQADPGVAGDALWSDVEWATERGFLAPAVFALVEAVEAHPDRERLAPFLAPLSVVESPLPRALLCLAQAVAERDVERLGALEETFAAAGAWLYACRAGVQRALALYESGDHVAAAGEALRVWERVIPRTRGLEGVFARLAHAVDLSPREVEIARYAVDGLAAVDIAGALVLSTRTVEHHLFKTYRKVGVDSRKGLRGAFETWLRPAHQGAQFGFE